MCAKKNQTSRPTGNTDDKPITEGRLTYLFNDMKDFVRSTVKGSETVLRKELKFDINVLQHGVTEHTKIIKNIEATVTELKSDVKGLKSDVTELKSDVKGLKSDVTELKSDVKRLDAKIDGVRTELKDEIKGVEHRLSEKFDKVIDKVENHEVRITVLERGQAAPT